MIVDMAFLNSFDVQWEAPHAALETGGAAASDDDDEVAKDIDTLSWVVTDPGTLPLKHLKLPARGKIQTHPMYAAAIVGIPDQRPPEVQSFLDRMQRRIEELALEYEVNDPELIITRPFTLEVETYHKWVEVHDRSEGAPDSQATKKQQSAPSGAPAAGARARDQGRERH